MARIVLFAPAVANETGESIGGESARLIAGLECRIGRARIAVPGDAIARIVEYRTLPLPLAKPWIGGVGLFEGVPLLSVALQSRQLAARPGALVKGVLLKVPTSLVGWALEVNEVFGFVRAELADRPDLAGHKLPRWIGIARTGDGRSLGWVNVASMLSDLAQVAGEVS